MIRLPVLIISVLLLALPLLHAQVEWGIAAYYPHDTGLEEDASVVILEDYEQATIDDLASGYGEAVRKNLMSFSADVPAAGGGSQSVLFTHPGGTGNDAIHLFRSIPNKSGGYGYDKLYYRTYVKFAADCHQMHHFGGRLGGLNPVSNWPIGEAGLRPAGDHFFSAALEPYGASWEWDWYNYWMEMRSWQNADGTPDAPYPPADGNEFYGNSFLNGGYRPPVPLGQWICIELYVKLNSPVTARNGEMGFWIDGQRVTGSGMDLTRFAPGNPKGYWSHDKFYPDTASPVFEGIKWRDSADLNINFMWTMIYITTAPVGTESKIWFDHTVVAAEYIGPINDGSYTPPPRPSGRSSSSGCGPENSSRPTQPAAAALAGLLLLYLLCRRLTANR